MNILRRLLGKIASGDSVTIVAVDKESGAQRYFRRKDTAKVIEVRSKSECHKERTVYCTNSKYKECALIMLDHNRHITWTCSCCIK